MGSQWTFGPTLLCVRVYSDSSRTARPWSARFHSRTRLISSCGLEYYSSKRTMSLAGRLKTRRLSVVVAAFFSLLLPAIASGYRVYIFRGGDADSDSAVAQAVQDRGHKANLGIATVTFDGTQVRL